MLCVWVAVGPVAMGCASESDTDQVRDTVVATAKAIADGDEEKACSYLAGPAQQELIVKAAPLGLRTCVDIVRTISVVLGPEEQDILSDARVGQVELRGDRAEVPDSAVRSSEGKVIQEVLPYENPAPIVLRKIDGTWLIVSLG